MRISGASSRALDGEPTFDVSRTGREFARLIRALGLAHLRACLELQVVECPWAVVTTSTQRRHKSGYAASAPTLGQ